MKKLNRMISLALMLLLIITMVTPTVSMAIDTTVDPVDLGTAESFALLAGSKITNTGTTKIEGDVGLHPGNEIVGLNQDNVFGEIHLTDADAEKAKADLLTAYIDAAGRNRATIDAQLGGKTVTPGVYGYESGLQITGTLILDGLNNPDSVFIFQAGSTLTSASGSVVKLINGANFKNVIWQVGSSATLGTNSEFAGNILAAESITATTGAKIQGKLLALGAAITLDSNEITNVTTSALTVIKIVEGDAGYSATQKFSITVTGPEGFLKTEDFGHTDSITWENIVPGKYTITENRTGLDNKWAVVSPVEVQVMAKQDEEVTITNTYNASGYSSLTVDKIVNGVSDSMTLPTFELTVTGPGAYSETRAFVRNVPYTFNNLSPGTYTITENRTGLNSRWADVGETNVVVAVNAAHTATITNTYTPPTNSTPVDSTPVDTTPVDTSEVVSPFGTLTVGKIVSGDEAGLTPQTFEIMVTGPGNFSETKKFVHNEVFTWSNLVPGDYTVMENRASLGNGWTVSGEGVVTVNANQAHSAVITNLYTTPDVTIPDDTTPIDVPEVELTNGSLTVQKIVTGNTSGMALPAFEITVTGPEGFVTSKTLAHNESFTWANLVPGEYNITENRTGLNSKWTVSGEGAADVVANQATMITITNNYRNVVGIPQTSQNTDYGMALTLGVIALMLAGTGVLSAKTRKKYNA